MHQNPRGKATQAGHERNTRTHGSVTQDWCQAGVTVQDRVTLTLQSEQGTPAPCACQSPPATALNCLQPEQELPEINENKAQESVPFSRQGEGNKLLVQVLYKALLKSCPTSPGKADKPDTCEELDPSTLFFQQLYFEISCSAKDMLYFLNINEYINIFPSCPCLTKCQLLATTIYYSPWFSISDNIFCISDYLT